MRLLLRGFSVLIETKSDRGQIAVLVQSDLDLNRSWVTWLPSLWNFSSDSVVSLLVCLTEN